MGSTIIEQDFPHDISHRGQRDKSRHNKRVDEATRKQLKDIISNQDIITSEGNKKVRVRLKYLDQYTFRHNTDRVDQIGRDQFDELEDGEIISRPGEGGIGEGQDSKPGEDVGEVLYETEYTIEELTDMMIEELELPDLDDDKQNQISTDVLEWKDRRKKTGIQSMLDKKQTIIQSIKRRKMEKDPDSPLISNDDLVYKTWNVEEEQHSNAVIFLMMDRSASMYSEKIYAVKALYFWIVQFLKRKYDKVEIKFIAHDYVARELSEKEFFSIADGGGTKISSAYELCKEMIQYNYPSSEWNIYCFHSSDGDCFGSDVNESADLVEDIVGLGAKLFAYAEIILNDTWRDGNSALIRRLRQLMHEHHQILVTEIEDKGDIITALETFLKHDTRTYFVGK